ncbi:hypothetical protein [Acidovorax sp. A1169]|uniref:hypothetical protein n=1 Tax=Acidovorax sp. A1169 TaxID=3059524 RepID=UPI0027378C02|nr:hypothetical protein [Acidovorax sp. A1169]MDP4077917.1 hypothetical protein [Acidovorax sp. A1169]
MRKHVLIGGGLGLLLLAIVAAGSWLLAPAPGPAASGPARTDGAQVTAPAPQPQVARSAPATLADVPAPTASAQALKDRRQRLNELRAEFNALRAQGMQASPEKARALIDQLEAISEGVDPRYFQALRGTMETSAKLQKLNDELQSVEKSTAPKDVARKRAIEAEMQALGPRVSTDIQNLQKYAPALPTGTKAP